MEKEWRVWYCMKPREVSVDVRWSHPYHAFQTEAEAQRWKDGAKRANLSELMSTGKQNGRSENEVRKS